jgi:hypothetical protein
MAGGIAVRGNVLTVTWSSGRGHVFLFDLEAQQRVSAWTLPPGRRGYCDAAGVAMDEHYHLFVADTQNDRVCHFNAFGRHIQDFGLPPPDEGDAARDRTGVLDRPHAVALVGDVLFVAGGDQPRRRAVQRFVRGGAALRPLAARGDAEAKFGAPRGLWASTETVLVADTLRGAILRYRADGTFLHELACGGAASRPIALLGRARSAVLFVDRLADPPLRLVTVDAVPLPLPDELATALHDPIGLAADRHDRVYVLDHGGERVVRLTAELQFDQVVVDLAERFDDPPRAP